MSVVNIYCESSAFRITRDEVLAMCEPERLKEIKNTDHKPFLKAWVVVHDGVANPSIIGGKKNGTWAWSRDAVKSAYDAIKSGIKFFFGHNGTNTTSNREAYGEVVGKDLREINGKLCAVVVGYFPPEHNKAARGSSAISMESIVKFLEVSGRYIAEKVDEITGIALMRSNRDIPAFPNATELASIQAFQSGEERGKMDEEQQRPQRRSEIDYRDLDFLTVQKAAKRLHAFPHQIFSVPEIIGQRVMNPDGTATWIGDGDHEIQNYIERKIVSPLLAERTTMQKELASMRAELNKFKSKAYAMTAKPKLDSFADEMRLSVHARKLAEANFANFAPPERQDDENDAAYETRFETSLRNFLAEQSNEVKRLEKMGFVPMSKDAPQDVQDISLGPVPSGDAAPKNPFLD